MDIYLPIAEVSIDVFVLLGLGGAVGFLTGVFGVGGGFLLTPLLIFIGVPPTVAVASSPANEPGPRLVEPPEAPPAFTDPDRKAKVVAAATRLDPLFADPLRRDELGKLAVRIVGIEVIEMREAIGRRRAGRLGERRKGKRTQ